MVDEWLAVVNEGNSKNEVSIFLRQSCLFRLI